MILIWIGAIVVILIAACYLIIPGMIFGRTLSAKHRKPKLEIPETYQLGWWANQECLTIASFEVEIVESKLNLFNSKSLIKYSVTGKIKKEGNWRPSIKNVHLSQKFTENYERDLYLSNKEDTVKMPEALIEITPIIKVKKDKKYSGESINFKFTNELKLESFHWGENWVRFQCGEYWKDLVLKQKK